jgi:PAS domain S-box-containing protein
MNDETIRTKARKLIAAGPVQALLFAAAYFLTAHLAASLSLHSKDFVNFWLPSGLYVAVLLIRPTREWTWFILAAAAANLAFDAQNGRIPGIGTVLWLGNSGEAVLGAWLVRRFIGHKPHLNSIREVLGLTFYSAILSTAVSATVGSAAVNGLKDLTEFWDDWKLWWSGDLSGILVVAPVILVWHGQTRENRDQSALKRMPEVLALVVGGTAVCYYTIILEIQKGIGLKFLVLPFIGWAALRFGARATSMLALLFALIGGRVGLEAARLASFDIEAMHRISMAFQLSIVITSLGGLLISAIMHERDQMIAAVRGSENTLRSLFHSMGESFALHEIVRDANGTPADYRIIECNRAYSAITGIPEEKAVGGLASHVYKSDSAPYLREFAGVADTGTPLVFETYFPPMQKHFRISVFSPRSNQFATVAMDITAHKEREQEVVRVNRIYSALRELHQTVLKFKSRQELFQGICRILVEVGGFKFSWICSVDTETLDVSPEGFFGAGCEFLGEIRVKADNGPDGKGPIAISIREGRIVIIPKFPEDSRTLPWHRAAINHGFLSAASFPVRMGERIYGALAVYASEPTFFQEEEVALLEEFATNVSLALVNLKKAEEGELSASELTSRRAELEAIYENAPIVMCLLDEERRIARLNKETLRFTGRKEAELLGLRVGEMLGCVNADIDPQGCGLSRQCQSCILMTTILDTLCTGRNHSGIEAGPMTILGDKTRNVHVVAGTARLTIDGTYSVLVCLEDATMRRQAEEALGRSEHRYQILAENVSDVIWVLDLETSRFTYVSPSVVRLRGFTAEEAMAQSFEAALTPDSLTRLQTLLPERVLRFREGEDIEYFDEIEQPCRNGSSVWTETITRYRTDEETGHPVVFGVSRNITQRKHLQEQLFQAEKMQAIGVLAGGVAHDFNNLLTVINGYGALLLEEIPEGRPECAIIEQIMNAGERAASLTSQLLAFSRKQIIRPKEVDLGDVINSASKMLHRLIGEDIDLVFKPANELGLVLADEGQMNQVVMNLAVNARDAMPQGGKLTIETSNFTVERELNQSGETIRSGKYVRLAVRDTGTGMDPDTQSRIFEPFFTTKGFGKGTGLGLSTVYGIIKQNSGHILVQSSPGQGTTFEIYLPMLDRAESAAISAKSSRERLRGCGNILVVEDDQSLRELTARILRDFGYTVQTASGGAEALSYLRNSSSGIEFLITDVVMPDISGKQLMDEVNQLVPGIRTLFISGYTSDVIARYGILEPEVVFLQKPFTPLALAQKVKELLG